MVEIRTRPGARDEGLLLQTVKFQGDDARAEAGVVKVNVKLTPAQVKFLRDFDRLLESRRAGK